MGGRGGWRWGEWADASSRRVNLLASADPVACPSTTSACSCCVCDVVAPASAFSQNQMNKGRWRRCKDCVGAAHANDSPRISVTRGGRLQTRSRDACLHSGRCRRGRPSPDFVLPCAVGPGGSGVCLPPRPDHDAKSRSPKRRRRAIERCGRACSRLPTLPPPPPTTLSRTPVGVTRCRHSLRSVRTALENAMLATASTVVLTAVHQLPFADT